MLDEGTGVEYNLERITDIPGVTKESDLVTDSGVEDVIIEVGHSDVDSTTTEVEILNKSTVSIEVDRSAV